MVKLLPVALLVLAAASARTFADEPLTRETSLHFATVEEGQGLVATSDTFIKTLSRFDRQVRLKTDGEATEAALIEFLKGEVVEWDDAARKSLVESIERLRPKLEPFHLPLPRAVLLIQMSGKDEANAAYTRGAAILLPTERVQKLKGDSLDRLLLHELFHVLSRHSPELRRDLYRIIGFEVCEPIALPSSLADLKLTNPDAPLIDCRIQLTEGDETFQAAPILYSSSATYDADKKPLLFKYVTFRLMKVEEHDGRWRPLLKEGEPVLLDPAQSQPFAAQIGQNTKYIIHPDEILADNFVHLVMQTEKLPSPKIVERMGERLKLAR
ncbi:MAG: hypothetical protein H7062_23920 [Candidatus Saccharimonas sp.]|nr:hypothetical protein [Planctomycetaceae bacterium]